MFSGRFSYDCVFEAVLSRCQVGSCFDFEVVDAVELVVGFEGVVEEVDECDVDLLAFRSFQEPPALARVGWAGNVAGVLGYFHHFVALHCSFAFNCGAYK